MNLNREAFRAEVPRAIERLSKRGLFVGHHGARGLAFLQDFELPGTYEQLFGQLTQLPRSGSARAPYASGPVFYLVLDVMRTLGPVPDPPLRVGPTHFADGQIAVRNGTVEVDGDLFVEQGSVFVSGDLVVRGDLADWDEGSEIVVLGDLGARRLSSSGEIIVGGSLSVDGIVHLHRNDFAMRIGGDLRAKYLLRSAHALRVGGTTAVERQLDPRSEADLSFVEREVEACAVRREEEALTLDSDALHAALSHGADGR